VRPDQETLEARLTRLEQERQEADLSYNRALTALDRAIGAVPALPHPPPPYDPTKLPELNRTFDILPGGPPAEDRSLKGRLRTFIWRLVGPSIEAQRHFNATLVDHLNRNAAAHEEAERAIASTVALLGDQLEALVRFQHHLIGYLQTITLYVDTRDRSAGAGAEVLNAALSAISDDWLKRWESLAAREARLTGRADSVLASLSELRSATALAQQSAVSLKREVERALAAANAGTGGRDAPAVGTALDPGGAAAAPSADLDAFKYLGFENAFRGDPSEIRRRLESYVPLFAGRSAVVEIGCGRGEFLDLLRTAGVTASGIDINAAMVEETRARGLAATQADALSHLSSLPPGSIGGLFAAQVVEHLEPGYLSRLIDEAARVIQPGGPIVLETINPTSWVAFFESYIRDLSHVRPLHPDTLKFLLQAAGFRDLVVEFRSPVDPLARLQKLAPSTGPDADLVAVMNDNIERLNSRLFGDQDYAVVGIRP
jgi:SAM-dependent methyltransferase